MVASATRREALLLLLLAAATAAHDLEACANVPGRGATACGRDSALLQTRQDLERTALHAREEAGRGAASGDDGPSEAVGEPAKAEGEDAEPMRVDDDFGPSGAQHQTSSKGDRRVPDSLGGEALQQVRAEVSNDGRSASVRFVHEGRPFLYQLKAFSVYGEGAQRVAHTGAGKREALRAPRRHFRAREHGKWASVSLRDDGAIAGLFEDQGHILEVSPADVGKPGEASLLAASRANSPSGAVHLVKRLPVPSLLGRGAGNATAGSGVRRLHLAELDAAREDWSGTPWWPGCYTGDEDLHRFTLRFVADLAAWERHGDNIQGLLEDVLNQASFVYEKQLNIRLELASLEIHKSAAGTPAYSQGCSGNFMDNKLNALTASSQPFEGATHLFTGCGTGTGTVGVAWVGSICNSQGYNTGINQLIGNSWLTFAHELGHNFGGQHSFENGQGNTGGIMDYGDGTLNSEYQFNTQYRRSEMCAQMNSRVNACQGKFAKAPAEEEPEPEPEPRVLESGDRIFLRAHTGARLTVQDDNEVHAEWDHQGSWQEFVIEKDGGGVISAGDGIYLQAHTGNRIAVEGKDVQCKWDHKGDWQRLTIEADASGPLHIGDTIWLLAHTGNRISVQNKAVHAKWDNRGSWEAFVIESKQEPEPEPETTPPPAPPTPVATPAPSGGDRTTTVEGCQCHKYWRLNDLEPCETYCCNPDNDANGDWCFVTDRSCQGRDWGYCAEPTGGATTPSPSPPPAGAPSTVSDRAWEHFGLVNQLRAQGTTCGDGKVHGPNPVPLKFDCRLWRASQLHSQDMADNGYFSHNSQDGRSPWDRARAQGITANAENIAAGRSDAQGVLDQWEGSTGHCNNMMDPDATMFAVGYAYNAQATYRHYWTQMLKHAEVDPDESCYPAGQLRSG